MSIPYAIAMPLTEAAVGAEAGSWAGPIGTVVGASLPLIYEAGKHYGPIALRDRYQRYRAEKAYQDRVTELQKQAQTMSVSPELASRIRGGYALSQMNPELYKALQPALNTDVTQTPQFAATEYLRDMGAIPGSPGTRFRVNGQPVAETYQGVLDYLTNNPQYIPGYRRPAPVRMITENGAYPAPVPTNLDIPIIGVDDVNNAEPASATVENNLGTEQPVENPDVVGDEDGTAGTEGGAVESNQGEAVAAEPAVVNQEELEDELEAVQDAQGQPIEEEVENSREPEQNQEEGQGENEEQPQGQQPSGNQPPKKSLLRKIFELEGNYTSGGGKAGKIARDAAKIGFIYGPAAVGIGEAVYNGIDYLTRDKMDYIDEEGNDIPYKTHWPASSWNPYGISWRIWQATKPDPEVEAEKRKRKQAAAQQDKQDNTAPNDTVSLQKADSNQSASQQTQPDQQSSQPSVPAGQLTPEEQQQEDIYQIWLKENGYN